MAHPCYCSFGLSLFDLALTYMPSKKDILAKVAAWSGVTRALESLRGRPSLLILTYHRVGDSQQTAYDSATFSCTAEELDWQVRWLKQRHEVLTLPETLDVVHGRVKPKGTSVLLTFDDGYRDNYELAFPVLRAHGASATFFLATAFVGTTQLPWWDEIAYMVKRAQTPRLVLSYPRAEVFELGEGSRAAAVVAVLRMFKRAPEVETERFLNELATATGCERPDKDSERHFVSWDEAREMQAAGMCFGSHTHTHELLGRLPYERQLEELRLSREIMERELGREVDTLAYPRGKPDTFTETTFAALKEARYSTAFSFYSGVNVPGRIAPLNVLRAGVDNEGRERFRLRAAMYATLGRGLV